MFEFGRDLRKLFERACESEDLGWVELVPAPLVEAEARRETTDAGRVSCARPLPAWLRAAWLWREHARRTGVAASLDRALACGHDALKQAREPDGVALARASLAETRLVAYDLYGGPERLTQALAELQDLATPQRTASRAALTRIAGRLAARRARLRDDAARLDVALEALDAARGVGPCPAAESEARLERLALAVELGVERRDPTLLDQAGQGLRELVRSSPADQRPLTRARALAVAGAGLAALGRLAEDTIAQASGRALFEAAADQFTPDHSPLDWVAVQLARPRAETALMPLAQCEALTREPGLVLGALAAERRVAAETALAEAMGDLDSLNALDRALVQALRAPDTAPLAWAATQIGLARIALARGRLTGRPASGVGLILAEAAQTAREHGVLALEARAQAARAAWASA